MRKVAPQFEFAHHRPSKAHHVSLSRREACRSGPYANPAGNSAGAGAGGVAGSAGGAGSFGAAGGVPVDAAVTCDDLHNQYAANLLVARRCTVDASGQCTQLVASSFPQVICGPSGGQTYVNDASALAPDWSEVLALHCSIAAKCGDGSSYSAIPDGGVCVATDGGSGLCALLLPYATDP
jgi:hypothetical protein